MENNCPVKPRNFKEFIRSSWFLQPIKAIGIGLILGIAFYSIVGETPYNNIFGDIIAGIVIGFFFTSLPCLTCHTESEQNF
jgi:hypothetical protein